MQNLESHKAKLCNIVVSLNPKETNTSAVKSRRKVSSFDKAKKKRQRAIKIETKVDVVYIPMRWESG